MRLLCVRHAESLENRRDHLMAVKVGLTKEFTQLEADAAKAKLKAAEEPNGDSPLTENGHQQAECFGEYWSEILEQAASGRRGKLHVYCSPMIRTMQTIDPLLRKLRAKVAPDLIAIVHRDLHEVPGLVHPADRDFIVGIQKLAEERGPREAISAMQAHSWTRAGQTPNEMLEHFEWLRLGEDLAAGPPNQGWLARIEVGREISERMVRLVDWLEKLRDTLPPQDTVLLCGHGDQTGQMLNELFARSFGGKSAADRFRGVQLNMHPKSNTSISSLRLDPKEPVVLEFFHRLDHLGPDTEPDTLMRGYKFAGLMAPDRTKDGFVGQWGLRLGKDEDPYLKGRAKL